MQLIQLNELINLLDRQTVTAIGLLLAICGLLIWHIVRQEKKYTELLKKTWENEEENKRLLIDISTKSITANEKTIDAINNIKDLVLSSSKTN